MSGIRQRVMRAALFAVVYCNHSGRMIDHPLISLLKAGWTIGRADEADQISRTGRPASRNWMTSSAAQRSTPRAIPEIKTVNPSASAVWMLRARAALTIDSGNSSFSGRWPEKQQRCFRSSFSAGNASSPLLIIKIEYTHVRNSIAKKLLLRMCVYAVAHNNL